MPFKKSKPKAGRTVRKTLADGTVKTYVYPPHKAAPAKRAAPDTIGALSAAWRRSPDWAALAPRTQVGYLVHLRDLELLAAVPVRAIRRKDIIAIRNAIASKRGNGSGQAFVRTVGSAFRWAIDNDWLDASPIFRMKALPSGALPAWTEAEAAHAMANLPEHLRRVVVLALHTGQRRGDLCAMTWQQVAGGTIRLTQEKTKVALAIPVHPALAEELQAWRVGATAVQILVKANGQPWVPQWLSAALPYALQRLGMRKGLNVHGLRKLAATRLAEAGCSVHEISAITGHRTLAMVQHYTASADQERLAGAAITRLQTQPGRR